MRIDGQKLKCNNEKKAIKILKALKEGGHEVILHEPDISIALLIYSFGEKTQ